MKREKEIDSCARCGGELPAPLGPALDALDAYLVRADAECPGHLRCDATGRVIGCGAWSADAYEALAPQQER